MTILDQLVNADEVIPHYRLFITFKNIVVDLQ